MTKGLMAGMTDYSHQTLADIVEDLETESDEASAVVKRIEANINRVMENGYWQSNVVSNFKSIVGYSLKHYSTAAAEMKEIALEIRTAVQDHHCKRLRRIANVAEEIDSRIGQVWHQEYDRKEYGAPDFKVVEDIYAEARGEAADLLDVGNIAARLDDFAGKSVPPRKNNPWISGSFYVFLFVMVIAVLSAATRVMSWAVLPIVLVAGFLFVVVIGALQLRNDEHLKEETFLRLMLESFKRLPLLRSGQK